MNKEIIRDQYMAKFDQFIGINVIRRPKEGWIRSLRKTLGMSSPLPTPIFTAICPSD